MTSNSGHQLRSYIQYAVQLQCLCRAGCRKRWTSRRRRNATPASSPRAAPPWRKGRATGAPTTPRPPCPGNLQVRAAVSALRNVLGRTPRSAEVVRSLVLVTNGCCVLWPRRWPVVERLPCVGVHRNDPSGRAVSRSDRRALTATAATAERLHDTGKTYPPVSRGARPAPIFRPLLRDARQRHSCLMTRKSC